VGGLLVGISAAAFVWEWACVRATREFFREQTHPEDEMVDERALPRASVLIPLRGSSCANQDSIRSLLSQDYPLYDVIVGVEDSDIAAVQMLRRIQDEHRGDMLKFVAAPNALGGRPKVGNLHNALALSCAALLAMVDADVVVGPEFLRRFLSPLLNPEIGLTTCLYRADEGGGVWSRIDALWTSTTYLPSALFGRRVIGETFAFGAAIGMRREVLDRIGGFAALNPRLGDDYQLGYRTAEMGFKVRFVPYVVTEHQDELSFRQLMDRRVRWCRTIRTFQGPGYAGSVITYGLPFAMAAALLAPRSPKRWAWLIAVAANRVLCAGLNRACIEPNAPLMELCLIPLRDALGLAAWALGFTAPRRVRQVRH
jgi:ceramide glucosyltransferase